MTAVTFSEKGNKFSIYIDGHAGYNPAGPDIVCAACSTLAYTLLQSVLSLESKGSISSLTYGDDPEKGTFFLELIADGDVLCPLRTVFQVIINGYALLEHKYPKNVKLCVTSGEK